MKQATEILKTTRRSFLQNGGIGLSALLLPSIWSRPARAVSLPSDATLVFLFLRGGADGIDLVLPRGDEANYESLRKIPAQGLDITRPPAPSELQLDGFFELHPALAPLKPLYDSQELAILHAVGGTGSYSHFTAQEAMERAAPSGPTLVADGWLHRSLQALQAQAGLSGSVLALSGVSLGPRTTDAMAGPATDLTLAFPSIADFELTGTSPGFVGVTLNAIYGASPFGQVADAGGPVFDAIDALGGIGEDLPGAVYSGDPSLDGKLQDAARLIKHPELGVKAIAIDYGGWDHHTSLVSNMSGVAPALASGLSAFWEDLGSARSRTLVLVATEFGRTAEVNGNAGTDHGWASVMFALGGAVAGGRVLTRGDPADPSLGLPTPNGHWPGLGLDEMHSQSASGQSRDLKATTDYRDVFGEILERFAGLPFDVIRDDVLRGYAPVASGIL